MRIRIEAKEQPRIRHSLNFILLHVKTRFRCSNLKITELTEFGLEKIIESLVIVEEL